MWSDNLRTLIFVVTSRLAPLSGESLDSDIIKICLNVKNLNIKQIGISPPKETNRRQQIVLPVLSFKIKTR